jgi:hypothetical protein
MWRSTGFLFPWFMRRGASTVRSPQEGLCERNPAIEFRVEKLPETAIFTQFQKLGVRTKNFSYGDVTEGRA